MKKKKLPSFAWYKQMVNSLECDNSRMLKENCELGDTIWKLHRYIRQLKATLHDRERKLKSIKKVRLP